jgi:hypothetical protein
MWLDGSPVVVDFHLIISTIKPLSGD